MFHTRPKWMIGNRPAVIRENVVIASVKSAIDACAPARRRELLVAGVVQGVGFRPFVHRTAVALGLAGCVRNGPGEVEIEISW